MNRRVVITGMGALTPIGNTAEEFWQNLKNGVSGFDTITRFDPSDYEVKIAGEVKNFEPEKYIQRKETKRMDLFCQFALAAATEAVEDAKINVDTLDSERFGVIFGSGIGGLITIEEQVGRLNAKGPGKVSPLFIPMAIGNMAAGNIAIKYGAKGICSSVVTACATGTNCIGEAFRNIKHGYSDIILTGGSEASITGVAIAGFTTLTALSRSNDPKRASMPFDKERCGFVMGEGAGVLVLEELEHAKKRGVKILAEVVGYGSTGDAYHMTSPCVDGDGAARAIKAAINEAGIEKEEVSYINAHGTSTEANDSAETMAIKSVFGNYAYEVPISSSKSMIGHLLGAAGAVEAVACVKALIDGFVPPTANYSVKDPECDLNYVPNKGFQKELKYVLSNSFGFGGHNAVICLKKWEA